MKVPTEVTEAIEANRDMLQLVVISLDGLSARLDEIAADVARIKEVQNELRGGLALAHRVEDFKQEHFGARLEPSTADDIDWASVEAYCSSCTRMVHIVEPDSAVRDDYITVRAKCKACGESVSRTLSRT